MTHRTNVEGTDHLLPVSGGFYECWCVASCCQRPQAPGGLPICVCLECCCDNDDYYALFNRTGDDSDVL